MAHNQPVENISKNTYELSKLIREHCPPIPADKNERIMAELDRIISLIEERRMSPTAMLEPPKEGEGCPYFEPRERLKLTFTDKGWKM